MYTLLNEFCDLIVMYESIITLQEVLALVGLPLLHIATGEAHSMVVSRSGAVFGWGWNK